LVLITAANPTEALLRIATSPELNTARGGRSSNVSDRE